MDKDSIMNAKQVVEVIRAKIGQIKTPSAQSVTIASLEALLAAIEPDLDIAGGASSFAIEHMKLQHASDLAKYAADVEVFKSVIDTAKVLIQSLILINGGSAVALLAFIGHLTTAPQPAAPISSFADPLRYFVIGVGTAALFAGSLCLGQKLYAEKWNRFGNATVSISLLLALSSIAAFAIGSWCTYVVFAGM